MKKTLAWGLLFFFVSCSGFQTKKETRMFNQINTAISEILVSSGTVHMAPLFTSASVILPYPCDTATSIDTYLHEDKSRFEKQKDDIRTVLMNNYLISIEQQFLSKFGKYKTFRIIDRSTIEAVLGEMKFSMAISNDERVQIGKLLGVNYLLLCDATYNDGEKSLGSRLVDVQTGQVLASNYQKE